MSDTTQDMAIAQAEAYLSKLPPDVLRPLLSRLANATPNSIYYSDDLAKDVAELKNNAETYEGSANLSLTGAVMMYLCISIQADGINLEPGDVVTTKVTGAKHGNLDMGSFEFIVRKHPEGAFEPGLIATLEQIQTEMSGKWNSDCMSEVNRLLDEIGYGASDPDASADDN